MTDILITPLTATAFQPFGDVIDCQGDPDRIINQGLCGRFHDRAKMEFTGGRAGLNLFRAEPRTLPLALEMIERHPDGSQAFIPMSMDPFLVIVSESPETAPLAFETAPGQAINFHKGTWHGVLTPLHAPGLFAVVDRIGPGANLEEHWYPAPYTVRRG